MSISIDDLKALYTNAEDKMPYFKRNTYEQAFKKYIDECTPVYSMIDSYVGEDDDVMKERISEIASVFVGYFKSEYDLITKKSGKRTFVTNHNSPLVIYMFPGILEYKAKWSGLLCDEIVSKWNDSFNELTISYGSYENIKSGFKTSICYITTAVCRSLNKADDCEELNLLRFYRDTILSKDNDGEELIKDYYNIAPTIVKRIDKCQDSSSIYSDLYDRYIAKCIEYIKNENYSLCKKTYIDMVLNLKKDYAY